ncbi:MAG: hypothetical protein KGN32_08105 [Burkholderiales bacterium]|nr:hypothetical protein [Burkholderiales bacterium]
MENRNHWIVRLENGGFEMRTGGGFVMRMLGGFAMPMAVGFKLLIAGGLHANTHESTEPKQKRWIASVNLPQKNEAYMSAHR